MKLRESEIFNNYIKLAIDSGLISNEIEKTADADDKTRYDSNSFSDIEILYGHKFAPNKEKDQSIIDVAHPDTMVVGPAYDAMNAVVENLHQRQDIMIHISLKDPDGHLVQRRYVKALDDLQNTLIATGFAMDASNEKELMILADSCAGRLRKEAFPFLALGLGAAAIAGITWYFTRAEVDVQNIEANSDIVVNELADVQGESYVKPIMEKIGEIRKTSQGYLQKMSQLSSLGREITEAAKIGDVNLIEGIHKQAEPLMNDLKSMSEKLTGLGTDLLSMKSDIKMMSGQSSNNSDWYNKLISLKDTLIGSDPDDILLAIDALSKAITQAMSRATYVIEEFKKKYGTAIAKKIETAVKKEEIPDNYFESNIAPA